MISKIRKNFKLLLSLGLISAFVVLGILAIWVSTFKIPDLESFEERKVAESTKIYDRTGEILLFDVFNDIKRTVVPLEEISPYIKDATLAIEDTNFYEHKGIKITSIFRAIFVNLGALKFDQGGSTITQQVVKNSLLTTEKRISRKIKEWVLALKLEKVLSKDEILSLYLNEIPYGGNLYGVEEASTSYFGKKASGVTLAEAAYLAALPKAPTYYSPYRNIERLEERKNLVLKEMLEIGYITEEEYKKALDEKVEFLPLEDKGIKAPHFVIYVRKILEEKYGKEVIEGGGLKVITTLDYEMQKDAEELAKQFALDNEKNFNAENIALAAVNPKTGEILSMVGSRDYFDEKIDGNFNVTTSHRQPGSAFKPFAYAAAFNKGYTPETVLFDLPTVFTAGCTPQGQGTNCYAPQNYDNIFRGPMTMREALAQSVNVPSVKTLYLAGLRDTIELARSMGIQDLEDSSRYGLTLVLGGGEVSLLDMVSAYGVFANNGVRAPHTPILEIKDKEGEVLEKKELLQYQVLPPDTAAKISDVLSDNVARSPAFGANSVLNFTDREVAVKTGTTNDYRDAWIIGYTPNLAVGAWAGNNDNSPMEKKIAGFIIAPFWRSFMDRVLPSIPKEVFPPQGSPQHDLKPILRGIWQGGESRLIDKISGKLATEYTPLETTEEVVIGQIKTILHWVNKDNPLGPAPENPERDPQYNLWNVPVREWVARQGIRELSEKDLPRDFDDIHVPRNFPSIAIIEPRNSNTYSEEEKLDVRIEASGNYPITKVEFFLNEGYIGYTEYPNFSFSFIPKEDGAVLGKNNLRAVVYDSVFNRTETDVNFTVN